ncbi:MAG TPA: hypothetical protein VK911_16875 [Vicinamibacterales bacterium]|nr:hypothetical protein [Vicinamibacterales bacterium]
MTWFDGRLVVSGSVSTSVAGGGKDSSFNAGDYDQDTMRLVEVAVAASAAPHPVAFMVADVRAAGSYDGSGWYLRPATLLVGVRPLPGRAFAVIAGVMQTPFAGSGRRYYGRDNVLVGLPLIYQYPSSLRPEALTGSADTLLAARGTGGTGYYRYGRYRARSGLPLVDARGWNAGVGVTAEGARLRATAAVARGSLSNPLSRGDGGGWQVSGRVEGRPLLGLVLGTSAARGPYADDPSPDAPAWTAGAPMETAFGVDAEYSRGYWVVRGEVVQSRREIATLRGPSLPSPLRVTGIDLEGRYRLAPGLYAAARLGRLWFGPIRGEAVGAQPWDADVTRVEGGIGWSPTRPVLLKVAYQYNWRPDVMGPRSLHRAATQAVIWF